MFSFNSIGLDGARLKLTSSISIRLIVLLGSVLFVLLRSLVFIFVDCFHLILFCQFCFCVLVVFEFTQSGGYFN